MISSIRSEEIGPHAIQFLGPIAGQGLVVFIVEAALVFLSEHSTEYAILGEARRLLLQFDFERLGIIAEGVVEKSDLTRRLRADRLTSLGQLQCSLLANPSRKRISPVL